MATARGSRDTRGGRGGVRGRPFSTVSSRNGSDDDQTRTRPHNNNRTDPTTRGGGLQQTQQPFAQSTNSSQGTRGSGIARSKRFTSNASPAAANLLLDQSWRATCKAGDPAYPKRMSDLYQTVCDTPSEADQSSFIVTSFVLRDNSSRKTGSKSGKRVSETVLYQIPVNRQD